MKNLVLFALLLGTTLVQAKPKQNPNIKEFDLTGPKGINIHVYQLKPAHPKREIIWIHGMPGVPQGDTFAPPVFFEEEALDDSIITYYDRPGFGGSGSVDGHWVMSFQTAVVGMLLDQNPKIRRYVAGWSAGGQPTLATAAAYPDKVSGIFIASGAVMPLSNTVDLKKIVCPIVLVHGEEDDIVPFESMPYLVEKLKKAGKGKLIVEARPIPNRDHAVVRHEGRAVHELLQELVDTVEKP